MAYGLKACSCHPLREWDCIIRPITLCASILTHYYANQLTPHIWITYVSQKKPEQEQGYTYVTFSMQTKSLANTNIN